MDTEGNRTTTTRWTWLRPGRHPGGLWPVAILLGFPIGGLIADLVVNGVDSVGTALAGGLIAGAIIGAAEWFALRKWVSWLWIPATTGDWPWGWRRERPSDLPVQLDPNVRLDG